MRQRTMTDAVAFEDEVLYVGGVALPLFDGYQESTHFKVPRGWPVLNPTREPTQTDIVLEHRTELFERPRIAAVILRQNQLATEQHENGFLVAEEQTGLHRAPIIVESSIEGTDRVCYFRVRAGQLVGDPETTGYSATIIAAGTARPSAAVWISGPGTDTTDVERITREIAEALCAPPTS